jgi:hypothetical protein
MLLVAQAEAYATEAAGADRVRDCAGDWRCRNPRRVQKLQEPGSHRDARWFLQNDGAGHGAVGAARRDGDPRRAVGF